VVLGVLPLFFQKGTPPQVLARQRWKTSKPIHPMDRPLVAQMTNAFSPAFKSAIDWSKDQKDRRISEQNSAKRAKRLASDDPKERAKAAGTMGPLSGVTENHRLKKNSKLG